MHPPPEHIPVLMGQVLAALGPRLGEVYVDCTAGLGGHAAAVAGELAKEGATTGVVVLNDADPKNLARAGDAVRGAAPGVAVHELGGNYAELPHRLGVVLGGRRVNMVLADLGVASPQIDDASRGFSFSHDGPLDMRMDPGLAASAADIVNSFSESQLAEIIDRFGEDRNARRIARKLVQSRAADPILTTARLADLVRAASGGRRAGQVDPATRTFQALRMAVNDELGSLEALLGAVVREAEQLASNKPTSWLAPGARLAVISFHSLEDRPVKRAMERIVELGGTDLTRGAKTADEDEVRANPRARSAKLRAAALPG